ncbi:TonB-dependent receptor [Chitinimonas arctica]|uniref:TonB-dependent receptor n=1 Tax=Chitinimonas arctica TaxID=2594795 RepID=A0A516SDG5_9NEIS|nr:TonB-dependent receptor [Chitinimonas arctica]QDQ26191.1 TonB-dependent receptor [Chitinimonas arctica]
MKLKKISQALLLLGIAGFAAQAFAEEKAEKIEVTGSRIKRIAGETPSAVTVISAKEIEQSGKASAAEVLRSITANSANSYNESFSNSFSPGASGISLRGLGQKSTLVLLNGRRVANYGFAQNLSDAFFDLNSIPASAIHHIDVLKDGASAVYGSDAIAGVVNIVLRKDFQGLATSFSAGTSTEGGMNEYRAAATGGIGGQDNNYNLMVSLDYFKRDSLKASERKLTENQDFRAFPGGLFAWSANGGTYRINATQRQAFANCPNGTVKRPASDFSNPYSGLNLTGDVCAFNLASYLELMPATERVNAFGRGSLNFGNGMQAYAEALVSHTKTEQSSTPGAISNTGVGLRYNPATGGLTQDDNKLPVGNPANPFAAPSRFGYAFVDVGPRSARITSDSYRLLAGLKGQLGNWEWDMAAGSAENKAKNIQYNRINGVALAQMLKDHSYDFRNPANSPAATDKLRLTLNRESKSTVQFADFQLSGDIAELPAGSLGMVVGADWRREKVNDVPDPALSSGLVLGQGATATKGSRNVSALFFELSAPITKTLELSLAGRTDRYSDFGSAFSPKLGMKWTPTKSVMFRSSYGEGFRAPTLAENAQSNSTFFVTVTDKFHRNEKQRVPLSVAGIIASNSKLEAEKSKSYSFGTVFEPSANFNASLDFYKIRQNKLVTSDDTQYVADHENDARYKDAVVRDPDTGNILYIVTSYNNVGFVETKGLDLSATWRSNQTSFGRFSVEFDGNYTISYKTQPAADAEVEQYVGRGISAGIYPRYKAGLTFGLEKGPLTSRIKVNHTAGYKQEQTPGQDRVASGTTVDLFGSYKFTKQLDVSLSVLNLFDKAPPFDASFANRYGLPAAFTLYDMRGRYVRGTANYKF